MKAVIVKAPMLAGPMAAFAVRASASPLSVGIAVHH